MDLPRLACANIVDLRSVLCHRCGSVKPEPYNLLVQRSNDPTFQRPNEGRFAPMSRPPYRPLRIVLGVFSAFTAVGGLFMIFASKPLIMRMFLRPPEAEVSTLLLFVLKEMGGFVLMLSLLLFFASRDPVRNLAIVNAVIAGLCILALAPLLSFYTLDIQKIYPGHLVWARSVVRLATAALLYPLRPRERY